jgi:hypothetical protein
VSPDILLDKKRVPKTILGTERERVWTASCRAEPASLQQPDLIKVCGGVKYRLATESSVGRRKKLPLANLAQCGENCKEPLWALLSETVESGTSDVGE